MGCKKEEKTTLKIQLQDRKAQYFELVREHRLAKAKLDSAKLAFNNVCDEVDKKSDRLTTLKGTMQKWLMFYSKLEGGTAHVDYDTQWVQNTSRLNQSYRGTYDFKQIPTRNARINANFVGSDDKESYLSSMPAVLDNSINGVKFIPWGANAIEQTSLPSRISGSVRLPLLEVRRRKTSFVKIMIE